MPPRPLLFLGLAAAILTVTGAAGAGETPGRVLRDWWDRHGDYHIRNLAYVEVQEPGHTELFDELDDSENPFDLPATRYANEFRPEASLEFELFYFGLKPRFIASRDQYEDGRLKGERRNGTETYLHEWTAQFFPTPELSFAYVREDLQWGPSFLLSPSNPFDSRNGRSEPKDEVEAADYFKAVWTPNFSWTAAAIVSVDDGRKTYRLRDEIRQDFRDTYALKADYIFDRGNASLIASTAEEAEDSDRRLGYYVSYNLTDAWIGYSEGSASTEDEEFLAGASYSFLKGPTLALEYFHNSDGTDQAITTDLNELRDLRGFVLSIPNREAFLRRNYLLLQAYQNDWIGGLDYILRYTHNLDDNSRSLLGHLEFDLNDHAQLFTSATLNDSGGGELDTLREYRLQAGLEFNF